MRILNHIVMTWCTSMCWVIGRAAPRLITRLIALWDSRMQPVPRMNPHRQIICYQPGIILLDKWQPPRWAEEPTRRCILEFREHFQNPYLAHRGESESGCDEEINLAGRRCTVIGRNQHACEVVLRHESISRQHAAIAAATSARALMGACLGMVALAVGVLTLGRHPGPATLGGAHTLRRHY